MSLKWPGKPISTLSPGKRYSLFTVANKLFPTSFLVKIIAFFLWTSPILFNFLKEHYEIDSIVMCGLLTASIVGGIPTAIVYLITLVRAPSIRKHHELIHSQQPGGVHEAMDAQKSYGIAMDDSLDE
jgi:hypothetical protein